MASFWERGQYEPFFFLCVCGQDPILGPPFLFRIAIDPPSFVFNTLEVRLTNK